MTKEEILSNLHKGDGDNVFEYILEDGEELSLRELKTLNEMGYVYHSQLLDVDFEDEDKRGQIITKWMNIYYFSLAPVVAEMKNPRKVFDYSKLTPGQIEALELLYAKFTNERNS